LSRDIQKPNDATAKAPDAQSDHAQALSNYANGLAQHTDTTAPTTASSLPSLQIVDASASTPTKADTSSPTPSTEKPGLLSRIAQGTVGTVEAVATGAYESGAKTYHTAVNAGAAVIDGVGQTYENRDQIAGAIGNGLSNAADAVVSAAQHPGEALTKAGNSAGGALSTISGGLEAGGAMAADGAVAAGKWVANHKLETTAMVGAAAVEVLSAGTATPLLAGLGALGAAGTVHGIFSLGDQLNAQSADISVLANPDASAQQREKSFNAIANATGGDALGLAGAATGLGAAKVLGAIRGAAPAAEALDATKPVEDATKPVIATTDAGTPADAATKVVPPNQPVEVHAPQQPAQPVDAHTPSSSSQPTDAPLPLEKLGTGAETAETADKAAIAERGGLPSIWQGQDGGTYSFTPKEVSDSSWHSIYESEFPEDERQDYDFLGSKAQDGAVPQARLQVSERDGQTAAFSMTSDYGPSPEGQKLLLPYLAVDKDLQGNGVGTAHLSRAMAQTAKDYPTAKGIAVEVEDPNAPGISPEAAAQRSQRIRFYTERHGAQLLDRPYLIPVPGQEPLPANLLWVPFNNEKPSEPFLHDLISSIYKHGYDLKETDPTVAQILGQYSGV
jgi:hypothetical protein